MKIRFMEILQPTEIREKVGPLTLDLAPGYEVRVEPVSLTVLVEPVSGGHRLDGGFDYRATIPCSRCLEEAVLEGSATFLLEYQPAHQAPIPEEETEVTLEEVQVQFYEEPELPLEDLVSQQMYLEIPEKALCGPDCKGLCSRCGANLNQGPCPCPPETDSRWITLGQFQKKP